MSKSFIAAETQLPEITIKVILISVVLTLILATSNAYLALKVGMLTSASIPAAMLSMGILRWFKRSNILENNLIQTAASAGEAVAGGIVYTVPALIMIHYWTHFNYWQNMILALIGGVLGVMFSIPLRHVLVHEPTLRFPEGKAIAQVLIAGTAKNFQLKP
ncbi:MAG: OPT/YSL family transporter, partial [Gammaproteobacteria bacterium]